MKKLALALACLVSVAFFASCDPEEIEPVVEHPEPSIAIIAEEGYLYDGQVIDLDVDYLFGFKAASNPETEKELAKFVVSFDDEVVFDTVIDGTEYTYEDYVYFSLEKEIIGSCKISATVTDADGKSNEISFTIYVDQQDELIPEEFTWNRHGSADATGLEEFGLQWTSNGKEDFAKIRPLEGAILYEFEPETWDEVVTELDKTALFSELAFGISEFKGVSAWASHDYDFVIGSTYDGENYLIHITHGEVTTFKGTDITITGEWK